MLLFSTIKWATFMTVFVIGLPQLFPALSPLRTREGLHSLALCGWATWLALANELRAEGTFVTWGPDPFPASGRRPELPFHLQQWPSSIPDGDCSISRPRVRTPGAEPSQHRTDMEHEQGVNLGCHKPLRTGTVNNPTNGLNNNTQCQQEKDTTGPECKFL